MLVGWLCRCRPLLFVLFYCFLGLSPCGKWFFFSQMRTTSHITEFVWINWNWCAVCSFKFIQTHKWKWKQKTRKLIKSNRNELVFPFALGRKVKQIKKSFWIFAVVVKMCIHLAVVVMWYWWFDWASNAVLSSVCLNPHSKTQYGPQ